MTFSSLAKWAYTTTINYESHLGITFGSTEQIIYAYSYHSTVFKLTRIDDSTSPP